MNKIQNNFNINSLNLSSVSSDHILRNLHKYRFLQPSVCLLPLKLTSVSSVHVPTSSVSNIFHHGPRIVLSPLKESIIRKSLVHLNSLPLVKKHRTHYNISKCNSKRCMCCNFISTRSTIKSLINGRVFSVKLNSDVD